MKANFMKPTRTKLGRVIRKARLDRDLKQSEVAKASGLKTSQVSALETGVIRFFPSAQCAVKMAEYLGVPPLTLLADGRADFTWWQKAFDTARKEAYPELSRA